MKKAIVIAALLSGLAGCAYFQQKSGSEGPYAYTTKQLGAGEYELSMTGDPGVSMEQVQAHFKAKGKQLCGDKVYLLRAMKEQSYTNASAGSSQPFHALLGQIDCVGTDYFEESPTPKN